jgi:hypothetical protein
VLAVAAGLAAAKLLLHLLTNSRYGYFRDELYFIACGEHLDWGYVDHAPLVALVARASRRLFGDSLSALRLLPAAAGALKVLLTGLLVRELGGGRWAAVLACLSVVVAPVYLVSDTLFSMNAFEPLFWTGGALAAVLAVKRGDARWWLAFGALAGLGLQNKHSMLFFGAAVVAGLLLTPERRFLRSPWLWAGGAVALVIFLPNVIWEYRHDWATLELLRNVKATGKNVELAPLDFVLQQFLILLPLTAPVWLAGLWFLLCDRDGRRFRLLGVAYLALLALMIALKGKNYYMQPIYPVLFAAGGVMWERWLSRHRLRWLRVAYTVVLVLGGAVFAPLALPVLPPDSLIRYQDALGLRPPKTEVGHAGPLPQHFGDTFGWPEMVEQVARVYYALPPDERARAAIYANNYGEAGAVDFFGPRHGLPRAISPHQNYFLWGPRDYDGSVLILLQSKRADAERNCTSVETGPEVRHPYAMAEEHFTIHICRGLKRPIPELWPQLKKWN